jgi:hypothetical protein
MTVEQLRILRDAVPFRPFTIHLADGRTLPVPHRDFVSVAPSGRIAIVYRPDDTCSIVDMHLETELVVGPPATADARSSG